MLMLLVALYTNAQIIVVQTILPTQTRYSDTWTAVVTNPIKEGMAIAELKISKEGKAILQAKSKIFMLPMGEYNLNYQRLTFEQPVLQPSVGFGWSKYLGQGNYDICIHIRSVENAWEGESCTPLEILPLSPPFLISPMNKEQVDELPLLTWSPPMPLNIYENLNYDLKLVEMMPMQSGFEALARNLPVLYMPNSTVLTYQYSMSNMPLNPGKTYAWQVQAKDQGRIIGETEVWQFTVKSQNFKVKEELLPDYYYRLGNKSKKQSVAMAKGCMGFTCEEETLKNYTFRVTDDKNKEVDTTGGIRIVPAKQPNHYIIYLNESSKVKPNKSYRLYITNGNKKEYNIDFIYTPPSLKE